MEPIILSETQLVAFSNPQTYIILAHFDQPQTPSEAARALKLPANTVHYHVNRLLEIKLLKVVKKQGRSKTYQTSGTRFKISKALLPIHGEVNQELIKSTLTKVEKQFAKAVDNSNYKLADAPNNSDYVLFDLRDGLEANPLYLAYEPALRVLEVSLSANAYAKAQQALFKILEDLANNPEGDTICHFSVSTFSGRALANGH